MGRSRRDQPLKVAAEPPPDTPLCPLTGVTIPECSCRLCIEAQIRRHSPGVLRIRRTKPERRDAA